MAQAAPALRLDPKDLETLRPTLTRMARIAKALFNVSAADVLLFTDGKTWRASDAAGALSVSDPASALVVQGDDVMWVPELRRDPRFASHPMVTDGLKLRFYAGAPIKLQNGAIVGALAVYDQAPKPEDARLAARLQDMAGVVANDFDRIRDMRERAAMLEHIRRSEERFQIAIEGAGLHVYEVDFKTRTLFKAGAEDSFFETPRVYEDLSDSERVWATVHPDDRAAGQAEWDRAMAAGEPYVYDYRVTRSDGRDIWAHSTARLIPDARGRPVRLVGALQNITETKTAEAEMHAARAQAEADAARLAFALDTANSAAWELDLSGPALIGADDLGAICGRAITVEDVINMTEAIVHREDRHLLVGFVERLREGGEHSVEHRIARIDNAIGWVRTSARVFDADGVSRIIFLTTDITERKRAEHDFAAAMRQAALSLRGKRSLLDAIARDIGLSKTQSAFDEDKAITEGEAETGNFSDLYDRLAALLAEIEARDSALVDAVGALRDARTAAEAANIAKSQFLAMMSHELRTPLNAVIGYAEILEEDLAHEGKAQGASDAQRICRAARNLLELINEVLDFSKIEAGRMEIKLARAHVPAILANVAEMTRQMAEAQHNTVHLSIDPALGDLVVDEARLHQCLLNLVSNACKFTDDGTITITAGVNDDKLVIEVTDTGCGITPAEGAKLFQPFVQADSSFTRKKDGTGLGLVITRKLAELMGGTVTFTSIPNAGSTFTLSVAAYPDIADAETGEGAAVVVVIDDDASTRDLVRRALTGMPFRVRAARNAEEGAALVQDIRPALVMLDIHLPDGSGWDLLAAFKADATLKDVPVIVLTIDDDRSRALALGAVEHVLKPLDRDKLAALTAVYARVEPMADEAAA